MSSILSQLPGLPQLAAFAAAVFVLNATPGVDFLLTVSRTLQGGARAGVAAALGISVGCTLYMLAAAFGLATLLATHPGAFTALQWAGAAYLALLGCGLLRKAWRGAAPAATEPAQSRATAASDFRAGLLTNLLNPKIALFFLAFLPQFVPAGAPDKTLTFLLLGAWALAQGLVFLLVLVALASRLARLQAPPALRRALNALTGLGFIALALRLLGGRLQPA